jgi:hypothetical protein
VKFVRTPGGKRHRETNAWTLGQALAIAHGIQLLKAGSSKWVHDTFPLLRSFSWQTGYCAFSLSTAGLPNAIVYVTEQEAHHRQHTFKEEFLAFLKRYNVEYDERYIWD